MERASSVLKSILPHENSEAADIFCGSRDELQMRQAANRRKEAWALGAIFQLLRRTKPLRVHGQDACFSRENTTRKLASRLGHRFPAFWLVYASGQERLGFREIRYLPFAELQNDTVPRGRFLNTRTTDVTPTRAVLLL